MKERQKRKKSILGKFRPHLREVKSLILDIKPTRRHLLIKVRILFILLLNGTNIIRISQSSIPKLVVLPLIMVLNYYNLVLNDVLNVSVIHFDSAFLLLWLSFGLKEFVLLFHHVLFGFCLADNICRPHVFVWSHGWLNRGFFIEVYLWMLVDFTVYFCRFYPLAELTWCSFMKHWIRQWQVGYLITRWFIDV